MITTSLPFRFSPQNHEYIALDTGEVLPHITSMLEAAGLVNDLYYSVEAAERGTRVHKLTADYDLGAIERPSEVRDVHKGYLEAHVKAMQALRPEILTVEEPRVHPVFRYGGRPDRTVRLFGMAGVLEIKSGIQDAAHPIQTALQAYLVGDELGLPPETVRRWCLYLRSNGRYSLVEHVVPEDFIAARGIIRRCCGR